MIYHTILQNDTKGSKRSWLHQGHSLKEYQSKKNLIFNYENLYTNNGTEKRDSMGTGNFTKMNMGWWLSYIWLDLIDRLCDCIVESTWVYFCWRRLGGLYHQMIKVASKLHLKDQYIQMFVVVQKVQREGFDVEPQTKGKGTKSAPYSQYHR